jgi:hypothetical protein
MRIADKRLNRVMQKKLRWYDMKFYNKRGEMQCQDLISADG